jgi:hypothetical protein
MFGNKLKMGKNSMISIIFFYIHKENDLFCADFPPRAFGPIFGSVVSEPRIPFKFP